MGTVRMGDDPATSVVDAYGRFHDLQNLVVADSSVFVTASGLRPDAHPRSARRRAASSWRPVRRSDVSTLSSHSRSRSSQLGGPQGDRILDQLVAEKYIGSQTRLDRQRG